MQDVGGPLLLKEIPRGAPVVADKCYPNDRVAGTFKYACPDATIDAVQYYFLVDHPLEVGAPVPDDALIAERSHFRLLSDEPRPRHDPIQLP